MDKVGIGNFFLCAAMTLPEGTQIRHRHACMQRASTKLNAVCLEAFYGCKNCVSYFIIYSCNFIYSFSGGFVPVILTNLAFVTI